MPQSPRFLPVALLVLVLLLSACAGAASSPSPSPAPGSLSPSVAPPAAGPSWPPVPLDAEAMASYDTALPLDLREEEPPRDEGGASVHDVSWISPGGGRVTAWLVVPPGPGPFAGLVYLHGSETWRDDLLDEAIAMARGGAVSLVLDAPFARLGENRRDALTDWEDPEAERAMTVQAIVDVRRAFDVLLARQDVDPQRLGFVGHSWGASLGVLVAALDERPGSLALIAGRPSWTGFLAGSADEWVVRARDRVGPAAWTRYLELLAPLDAMASIGKVEVERLYLQYGSADDVVPPDVAAQLIDAAPGARTDVYDAGHALDAAATADRVAWLSERLALQPIPAEVVAGVGLPDR